MTPYVVVQRLELAGIPVLHVYGRDLTGPGPTVFFFHGWSSRKERNRIALESLALAGLRVLAPDAIHHGERGALPSYEGDAGEQYFWQTVIQTIEEAEALQAAAVAAGLADPDRIGVTGHSMGGFITAGVLARYDWVRAAVLLNGAGSYGWAERLSCQARGIEPKAERLDLLGAYDPERRLDRIAPRPVLLLHGSEDQIVPAEASRRFYRLAQPHYAQYPDRLVLTEIPRLNHYVTQDMIDAARQWFVQHL
jgi:dipeptidyl aminopeptidase/acylaminoacyl peptidase